MTTAKFIEQKVILLGDYGVGKTSLFRRFAFDTFVVGNDRKSTIGLDFYDRVFKTDDGNNIKVSSKTLQSSKILSFYKIPFFGIYSSFDWSDLVGYFLDFKCLIIY